MELERSMNLSKLRIRYLSPFIPCLILMFVTLLLNSCNPCDNCGPLKSEPYVKIQFYKKSNLGAISVAIRNFNEKSGPDITYFQDTTSQYILPLSMWADSSLVILTYAPSDNYDLEFVDTLNIAYQRTLETSPKNIVKMVDLDTQILSHTFDSLALICKDTVGICKSNESTIRAYF